MLGVFGQRTRRQPLLIPELDPAKVEHAILHRGQHPLTLAAMGAVIQRRDDAERQMQTGAAIADLRAGDQRHTVIEASGRGGAAGALRDVLIDLAILEGAGAEALDRGHDHAGIDGLDLLPAKTHALHRAGGEILHQHVAFLDQSGQHFLTRLVLGVQG